MINLTILTLIDGQIYKFSVADTFTILELKQHIAGVVNVPVPEQQLIFLAKVLNDETKIAEIGIHGNVIHLLRKTPPLEPGRAPVTYADSLGDRFGPQNMHSSDSMGSHGMSGIYKRICFDNIRRCNTILNRLNPLIFGTSHSVPQCAEDVSTPRDDIFHFGEIMQQLSDLNIRLQPFYTRYMQLIYVYPQFASIERSQKAHCIFDGLSDVSNYMTNTFRVLGNLRPCPHGYEHGPCPNCAQQPNSDQPFAVGQSVPNVHTFRSNFMNQVRAENANLNASTSATRADTANTNTGNINASLEFSSETPNGVGHMYSYYSFDHAPGTPEGAFATPNASGSSRPTAFQHWSGPMNGQVQGMPQGAFVTPNDLGSSQPTAFPHWSDPMNGQVQGMPQGAFVTPNASSQPTAFPHWSGPMNGQASSEVRRHFISDQPITSTGIGLASTGLFVHRHGHTSIANNRTSPSTGTDPRSTPRFLSHLNQVRSQGYIPPHYTITMSSSNNVNAGEQNINSFANSSPREIDELFDTEVFHGVQRLSVSDWPLLRSPIPTTRIQSASTRSLVHVPRHTSQFMGQFLPRSSHHFKSNWVPRMPAIQSAHRLDMSTFSSSSTLPESRPINGREITGNRNQMAESNGFLPCIRPCQIPGNIHHINIATTSSSNNAEAREKENEPKVEQTSNVDNEDQYSESNFSPLDIEFFHEPKVDQTSRVRNEVEQSNNSLPTQLDVINGIIPEDSIGSQGSTIYNDFPSELGPEIVENSRCQKRQRTQSPNIDANFSDTSNKQRKMD